METINKEILNDIKLIEIELFSYCNRTCKWCPNKKIKRDKWKYLPEEIFDNLLLELKEWNYQGIFSFVKGVPL